MAVFKLCFSYNKEMFSLSIITKKLWIRKEKLIVLTLPLAAFSHSSYSTKLHLIHFQATVLPFYPHCANTRFVHGHYITLALVTCNCSVYVAVDSCHSFNFTNQSEACFRQLPAKKQIDIFYFSDSEKNVICKMYLVFWFLTRVNDFGIMIIHHQIIFKIKLSIDTKELLISSK